MLFFLFLFWVGFCAIVGNLAQKKGRSFWGYFFLSLFISPVIGILIILVMGQGTKNMKKCPACAEYVQHEAKICKHCNKNLSEDALREMMAS